MTIKNIVDGDHELTNLEVNDINKEDTDSENKGVGEEWVGEEDDPIQDDDDDNNDDSSVHQIEDDDVPEEDDEPPLKKLTVKKKMGWE